MILFWVEVADVFPLAAIPHVGSEFWHDNVEVVVSSYFCNFVDFTFHVYLCICLVPWMQVSLLNANVLRFLWILVFSLMFCLFVVYLRICFVPWTQVSLLNASVLRFSLIGVVVF